MERRNGSYRGEVRRGHQESESSVGKENEGFWCFLTLRTVFCFCKKQPKQSAIFAKSEGCFTLSLPEAGCRGFPLACSRLSTPAGLTNCSLKASPGCAPAPPEDRICCSTLPFVQAWRPKLQKSVEKLLTDVQFGQ